jgi:chemotaxis protein histidine kinase CheA
MTPDPALLELYRAELDTHLPILGEGLLALEKDGDQSNRLDAMMRAAHSINFSPRIVGIEAAVRIAHVLEDCLVAAQKGEIALKPEAVDVLLRGVDALSRVAQPGDSAGTDLGVDEMVTALEHVRHNRPLRQAPVRSVSNASVISLRSTSRAELESLRQRFQELVQGGAARIDLDLAGVTDLSPAALALLWQFAQMEAVAGTRAPLRARHVADSVRAILHVTGLDRSIPVHDGNGD